MVVCSSTISSTNHFFSFQLPALQKRERKIIHMAVMGPLENSAKKQKVVDGISRFEALKSYTTVVSDTGEINAIKE